MAFTDFFLTIIFCRACDDGGQAKAMLAVSVIVIAIMCIVIFAVDLQFGKPGTPGLMSKAKIFIAHLQVCCRSKIAFTVVVV